jgi:hypothetical protein
MTLEGQESLIGVFVGPEMTMELDAELTRAPASVDSAMGIVTTGVGFHFQRVGGRIDALKPCRDTSQLGKTRLLSFVKT